MITVVTDSRPLDVSPSLTIVLKKIVSTTDTNMDTTDTNMDFTTDTTMDTTDTNMDFTTSTMDTTDTAIIETTLDH